jgi:hypothetical protein
VTPILETTAVALVYILVLQPFYLLEILPFWGFLEEEKKKPFCRAWVVLAVAETALTVWMVRSGLFCLCRLLGHRVPCVDPPVPVELLGHPEVLGGPSVHPFLPDPVFQLLLYLSPSLFPVFLAGK